MALPLQAPLHPPWITFPFLSAPAKRLMDDTALALSLPSLQPSRTPPDVRSFRSPQGHGEGSVLLRSGSPGSKIDFVLGSWMHCDLPFGSVNIATLAGMVNTETDAPHLLFEFIHSANSLVVVLDLLPRKDIVLDPDYLKRFYDDTGLETIKQELVKASQAQRYEPPTLYIRCLISPTAIIHKFEPADGSLDRIIEEVVYPAAKRVVQVWLEGLRTTGRKLLDGETQTMLERDKMIKLKGVEVDLSGSMPRLFGQDITDRVIEAFRRGE